MCNQFSQYLIPIFFAAMLWNLLYNSEYWNLRVMVSLSVLLMFLSCYQLFWLSSLTPMFSRGNFSRLKREYVKFSLAKHIVRLRDILLNIISRWVLFSQKFMQLIFQYLNHYVLQLCCGTQQKNCQYWNSKVVWWLCWLQDDAVLVTPERNSQKPYVAIIKVCVPWQIFKSSWW